MSSVINIREKVQSIVTPQISIVVPIFNTEEYLDRCIQSIVKQTEEKLEIMLVDDGSTDSSGSICDEWVKRDERIRVIHKINEGVTIARKTGVENAFGEWICFVDSDDELPEKSMQLLLTHARDDIDIVSGCVKFIGNHGWPYPLICDEKNTLQYVKSLLKYKIHGGPVARLIRKNIFDSFTFDIPADITLGEDLIMNIRLGQKARRIVLLPDIVYHYMQRNFITAKKWRSQKKYEKIFDRIVCQSILPENRNVLKGTIIWNYLLRRKSYIKSIIKNIMIGRRAI